MTTQTITVTRLADLRFGDRIKSWDGRPYNPPRRVVSELGTITAGSPVQGVRLTGDTGSAERPEPANMSIRLTRSAMRVRILQKNQCHAFVVSILLPAPSSDDR